MLYSLIVFINVFLNVCQIVNRNLRNTSAFQPEGIIRHGSPTDGLELTRHTSIVQWKPHQWAECGKALERRIPVTGSLIHTPTGEFHKDTGEKARVALIMKVEK